MICDAFELSRPFTTGFFPFQTGSIVMIAEIFSQQWVERFAQLGDNLLLLYLLKKVLVAGVTLWIVFAFWRVARRRNRSRFLWTVIALLCFYSVYISSAFLAIGYRFYFHEEVDEDIISVAMAENTEWLIPIFLGAFALALLAVYFLKRKLQRRP